MPFSMTSSCILGFHAATDKSFFIFILFLLYVGKSEVFLRQITEGCKHNSAQLDKWLKVFAVEDLTPERRQPELQRERRSVKKTSAFIERPKLSPSKSG